MGKRSVKENKNIYQISRENRNLTREAASEELVFISPERIEKIESGKVLPHPDEVLAMESGYRNPELCNWSNINQPAISQRPSSSSRMEFLLA